MYFFFLFFFLIIYDPNQRRQVLYSQLGSFWTLLLRFPDAFQRFHLLLIFLQPPYLKKKNPCQFFDTLKQTFLTETRLLSLGSELEDSFPSLDDLDVSVCFFSLTFGEEQTSFKLAAAFIVAWRAFDCKPVGAQAFQVQVLQQKVVNHRPPLLMNSRLLLTKRLTKSGSQMFGQQLPIFWRSGFLVLMPSCHSSFDGGNLVFSSDGLCNYVQDAYRLLREMPLKHLHSAKVHIRAPHLAAHAHNH